jgi:hypothetical protein
MTAINGRIQINGRIVKVRACQRCGDTISFRRPNGGAVTPVNLDGSVHRCPGPKKGDDHIEGKTIIGTEYRETAACRCGLPPWEPCDRCLE